MDNNFYKRSKFIKNLVNILEVRDMVAQDEKNTQIIRLDSHKHKLIIFDRRRLQNILPRYFKHSNFMSFARQLNWFGFEKIRRGQHIVYRNQQLKNGVQVQDLQSKRRKSVSKNQENSGQSELQISEVAAQQLQLKNNMIKQGQAEVQPVLNPGDVQPQEQPSLFYLAPAIQNMNFFYEQNSYIVYFTYER